MEKSIKKTKKTAKVETDLPVEETAAPEKPVVLDGNDLEAAVDERISDELILRFAKTDLESAETEYKQSNFGVVIELLTEVLKDAEKLVGLDSKLVFDVHGLALRAYMRMSEHDKVIETAMAMQKINPVGSVDIYYFPANIQFMRKNYVSAFKLFSISSFLVAIGVQSSAPVSEIVENEANVGKYLNDLAQIDRQPHTEITKNANENTTKPHEN